MISNIGGENNIHANHLNIFIFSSLLLSSINSNLSSIENLVLSDAAATINNLSELDGFKSDGLHTIFIQAVGEPFVKGGLYLLEVKTQTFTLRSAGYVQTMTRIFPVTDNTPAAIIATRTMYNSYKGNWITVC